MELALELGMTLDEIGQMSEDEFIRWQRFRAKHLFPARRMELYLAQISFLIASSGGARNKTIEDYMLKSAEAEDEVEDDTEEPDLEELKNVFQFNPRNRK